MFGDTLKWATDLDASGFASGAQRVNSALGQMGMRTQAATMDLGALGTVLNVLANPMTGVALAGMAVGAALAGSVQAAAAWQSSMAGVSKTTGLAGPELAALSKELLDLSTNMPVAASELASIAQAGGSLGIAKEELAGFTEVAAQMGVGFEMAADKAATSGAKILNAFGQEMNTENLRSLGSVVNAMGDSFAATEPQVLDFLNRASFLNATMGQNIQQVAALGTTLISAGMDAEVAATGIKSALNMLTSETSKKGGMDNWAKLMGVSVDELKEKIETDLNSVLIETANQIAAIEDPVERFQAAVAAAGTEGAPAILKLAGQQENYAKALGMTNDEWEKANSLQKTFDAQASTANSQWQMFLNTLNMAAVELGTVMLPAISEALAFMSDLVKVSIRVGEELYNIGVKAWDALAPLREFWKYTPTGVASNLGGQVWGAIKDWAGIGEKHAEQMAKEISENENLQKAGEEAIQVGIDKGVFKDAGAAIGKELGKNAADEFGNEFIAQANFANLSSLAMLDMINSQTTKADKTLETEFEYLDRKYTMKMTKGGSGWYHSLFDAEGNLLGQYNNLNNQGYPQMDPATAFQKITGLPGPEEGTVDYFKMLRDYLNAERVALQNDLQNELKSEPINLWDAPDTTRSWTKFMGENEELAKQAGDLIMYELYNAQNAAIEAGDATLQESFGNVMKGLADPGSVPANIFNQSLADIIDAGYVSEGHRASMQEIAENDAEEFRKNLVGGAKIEMPSLLEMVEDPKLILETFESIPKFQENYLIPRLTENMDEVKELMTSGVKEQDIIDAYIKPLEAVYDYMPEKLQDIYRLVTNGQMSLESFVEQYYDDFTEKADEKASEAAEAFKSTNAMFYNEILDDSEHWSNYINSEGGFIGPTAKWYEMKIDEQAELNNIAALKQLYESMGGESPAMVGSIATKLDTTEAYNDLEAIKADIVSANPTAMLELDTSVADSRFQNFYKLVEESRPTMYFDAVPVVDMGALVSAIAAALRAEGV